MRFRRVVRVIAAAKPDPGFQLKDIPRRTGQFISEVLLQSKVIKERPLPGIAHAFVFWGFCAFALITVNHFAEGFGFTLLSRDSAFGRSISASSPFSPRPSRSRLRGSRSGALSCVPSGWERSSPESGIIALLIFMLMVTYLAALAMDEGTTSWWALWWCHTLALLIFLPLIPHTKHLHLVLSPATIFAKRDGFSDIPPLAGDEDFGLDDRQGRHRIDALQAFSCVECGRCSEHCPAFNTGKTLNPKEVILGMREYLKDEGPASESPLLGKFISQEAVFQCTTCGGCEFQCPVGIQHLPMMIGLRRGAVNTGTWEDDYGSKFFNTLERSGNSLGFAAVRTHEVHREERAADLRRHARSIACGWAAWAPTTLRDARLCWRWSRCCGISTSRSACCARSAATAIRRAGWATICCSPNWPRPVSRM